MKKKRMNENSWWFISKLSHSFSESQNFKTQCALTLSLNSLNLAVFAYSFVCSIDQSSFSLSHLIRDSRVVKIPFPYHI